MTVQELLNKITGNKEDFGCHIRNFLDVFYGLDQRGRQDLLASTLKYDENCRKEFSFVAAALEKLCNQYGLECPQWVFDRRLYFNDPVFPGFLERTDPEKKSKLRIVLMVESPPEFKVRNIFVSRNCLTRA